MAPNMNTPDPNAPDINPPATVPSSGGLSPTQKLQPRKLNTSSSFSTAIKIDEKTDYTPQGYVGQGLVDKNGNIVRGQYGNEAYAELAKFKNVAERKNFLNRLYQVGLYQGSKPTPSGFAAKDQQVMQDALDWANWRGYTIDVAATMMATELGTVANPGNRIRTTAKEDLRSVFKQTASSVLGRTLSDSEVEKFVRSYNQQEVAEGMGGAPAPTAATAAEQAVTAAAPDEAAAMGASTLMDLFDKKIKGFG